MRALLSSANRERGQRTARGGCVWEKLRSGYSGATEGGDIASRTQYAPYPAATWVLSTRIHKEYTDRACRWRITSS